MALWLASLVSIDMLSPLCGVQLQQVTNACKFFVEFMYLVVERGDLKNSHFTHKATVNMNIINGCQVPPRSH